MACYGTTQCLCCSFTLFYCTTNNLCLCLLRSKDMCNILMKAAADIVCSLHPPDFGMFLRMLILWNPFSWEYVTYKLSQHTSLHRSYYLLYIDHKKMIWYFLWYLLIKLIHNIFSLKLK